MRVLLVTHYFPEHRSGIEIVAREIAVRLAARGHAITWAAGGRGADAGSREGFARLPARAWNVTEDLLGVPYPLWGPAGVARLAAAVRSTDVVHIHDCLYMGNVAAALAALALSKPVVVTQHVGWIPYSSAVLRGAMSLANHTLGRAVLGGAHRCVFCSYQVRSYFSGVVRFVRPPAVVPNGVDFERFFPLTGSERARLRAALAWDGPVILFVGRFVEKKGLSRIRRLAEQAPDCRFVLVGRGPERPDLWGLDNVRSLGTLDQSEIAPYYQAADLLLLPSLGEGFPLVVQEAMACGTPALISEDTARAYPAVRHAAFVSHLDEGSLRESLHEVLRDPERLAASRTAASDFARAHWSWTTTVDAYEAILQEAVQFKGVA